MSEVTKCYEHGRDSGGSIELLVVIRTLLWIQDH